jgi:hypothetical protein
MRWKQLDPDEAMGLVWLRRVGPFTLQVFGDEKSWGYTIARYRIIVRCVAVAADSPEKAMALADQAFAESRLQPSQAP